MLKMFSVFALIFVTSMSEVLTQIPAVLVLSFDGFHPDNMTEENTPYLFNELHNVGAGPPYILSVFPTKTFVTHFSLSTGVYPETHGIYGNEMFSEDDDVMPYGEDIFQKNQSLVPIWIENQNAGNGRHSGVMMWPGSDFEYDNTVPTHIEPYNTEMEWEDRATKIVEWMTTAKDKANFVMAYFEDTPCYNKKQRAAHFKDHFKKIDETIFQIYNGLNTAISRGNLEMIIMSDHGTLEVDHKKVLEIEAYFDNDNNYVIVSGPLVFIKPLTEFDNILTQLSHHEDNGWKYTVHTKDSFEDYQKMNTPHLEGIIVLVAKNGYTFIRKSDLDIIISDVGYKDNFILDENGYDIYDESMNGFFMGIGQKFKDQIYTIDPFSLIDVYPLLKLLLDLPDEASSDQNNLKLNSVIEEILEEGVVDSFKAHHDV